MIERIEFKNFKALRSAVLPLGRFTLIVGPNGVGKTTALRSLEAIRSPTAFAHAKIATAGTSDPATITVWWGNPDSNAKTEATWRAGNSVSHGNSLASDGAIDGPQSNRLNILISKARVYALDADQIARAVELVPALELSPNGYGLAGVLDGMRDGSPERFDALKRELPIWFPEYDSILFDVPAAGHRNISLRTRSGNKIAAADLSQGTLLALAMLTLAYLPDPPEIMAFEEPDRGVHPRLLREIRDALYRLSYPESVGESRPPVQVIATTHSPYFLDLFKEHPEEIVIAQKLDGDVSFERLSDRPDIDQILDGASLGDVWYSGILGGVPVAQ
jgi:predicted ATPase